MKITKKGIRTFAAGQFGIWVDARKRLPEVPGEYIVHIMHAEISTVLQYLGCRLNGEAAWCDSDGVRYGITHWMKLPEPPDAEEENRL